MDATGMTRIVHLSDAHVLDPRPSRTRSGWSMRVRFLSFGRPLDALGRQRKLRRALRTARQVGAHHVVVSGDLTEIGAPGEFETLAESLLDSGIAPERITLVPGNHDLYSSADAWRWALAGPLAPFARTSARHPGQALDIGGATLLPVDATFHQPVTRSAGIIDDANLEAIERHASDGGLARRPLVIVQHHPPFVRKSGAWHWIDGLIGAVRMMSLLERFRHLFVLHGHLHTPVDRALGCGVRRIFGATATVDDDTCARVRVYDIRDGRFESVGTTGGADLASKGTRVALQAAI
ncbi:MAG TPA: metallophosphoesterase [Polyangiaceae bacterium]|nr:metallophosphoesterase [Polyangiaceae bacterium]